MKRRDFFKVAALGAASAVTLVACTSSNTKLPDPVDCKRPRKRAGEKPRYRGYMRISSNDMDGYNA